MKRLHVGFCPCLVSVAVINIMTKSDLEKKGFISIYTSRSVYYRSKSGQEVKAGTWKLELKERPQRNAAYWLAFVYHPEPPAQGWYRPRSLLG